MPEIVLTEEQWAAVAATDRADVRDPTGRLVGWLSPAAAAAVERYRRQKQGPPRPTYTSEQMRRHLAAVQAEWEKHGGKLPPGRVNELFAELAASDPPAGGLWPAPEGAR